MIRESVDVDLRLGGERAEPKPATLSITKPVPVSGVPTVALQAWTIRDEPGEKRKGAAMLFRSRKAARQFARALLESCCDNCKGTGLTPVGVCRHVEPD